MIELVRRYLVEPTRRYLLARKVCKKYGIKFKPIISTNAGFILFNKDENKDEIEYLSCCIWDKNFYEILAHEIGHIIDFRVTGMCRNKWYYSKKVGISPLLQYESGRNVSVALTEEMVASRNAVKILKVWGKYTEEGAWYLSRMFGTYLHHLDKLKIADISYSGMKFIGSTR